MYRHGGLKAISFNTRGLIHATRSFLIPQIEYRLDTEHTCTDQVTFLFLSDFVQFKEVSFKCPV